MPEARNDREAPDRVPVERVAAWDALPGVVHGFYGRRGGHSRGPWASFNLSEKVGDAEADVRSNWSELGRSLGEIRLVRMDQVHGAVVRVVTASDETRSRAPRQCDGLLTREPGVGLVVMTADCVPILMVAAAHRVAMALHAGWRGTVAGIVATALTTAHDAFGIAPAEWLVALGPAIGGCCYEVTAEIGDELTQRWGPMSDAWHPSGRRGQLDLRLANEAILSRQGVPVDRISRTGSCTACDGGRYFSHRRSGGRTGRQVSIIGFRVNSALSPTDARGRIAL
jgi:hypothetical protein